ncbi:hypothetical protein BH23BAC4_BH23BAC4_07260 [soil metagenome]
MEVAESLRSAGVRRLLTILNGKPVSRAVQGRADGEQFLIIGQALMRDIGAKPGDMVSVTLAPDPNPDVIEICEELQEALEQDEAASERFNSMPPGTRRSLAYYADSAKRPETRLKRAYEIAHKLSSYTLYGDLNPQK